jgi:hypothetical protein
MALQRFTESFSISKGDIKEYPIQEQEGISLKESADGKEYSCIARYRVPISKINDPMNKNLNGRVYNRDLWENVSKNQKHIWEGCIGLADHPGDDSEGSVKDVFAVWHNLGLNESTRIVEADLHLVGPFGKLAEEVIQAGGKLGFSSSGFGELLEDGETVNPSSYMLERVSDWVLTPSQEVYGTKDMKKESTTNSIKEKKENIMAADTPNTQSKVSKLEERKFRRDVENFLKEAIDIQDPKARLIGLKEIHSYFEEGLNTDLKEKVEAEIAKTEGSIDTILKEHVKLAETFGIDNVEALKEGVAKIATDKKVADSQTRDWKKVSGSLQETIKDLKKTLESYPTPEAYESALAFNRRIRLNFIEQKNALRQQAVELEKQLEGQIAVGAKLKELVEATRAEKMLEGKKVIKLRMELKEALEAKVAAETKLKESQERISTLKRKYESAPTSLVKPRTSMPVEFTEKKEVEAYFNDLTSRHGKVMNNFKARFLGMKTLQEAMMLYTKILPTISEVKVLPGNVSTKERLQYLKETTGRSIVQDKGLKLPEGWD